MDIKSSSNKIIKEVKSLDNKKNRFKKGLFIIEGIRIIEDAIKSHEDIKYILYSDKLFDVKNGKELFNYVGNEYETYKIDHNLFKDISDTENTQGIIAVLSMKNHEIKDMIKDGTFIVILDKLQDPGNMGTIIRSADALGASGIIVSKGSVDIYNQKVLRSTMGSLFHMPIVQLEDTKEVILGLKNNNVKILATTLNHAKYCYDINLKEDIAIVIGNEGNGLDEEICDLSDENIIIPMDGKSESLNVAMASSIIMYEVLRQRRNI
ncbi:MAG: TrmH family RNA methyltransferase [Senegalia sp. (in: firmicutes)]|uniref:TrmH family RNA methyltransferase n=1 Tax=Senegalia sp. (in: firmicutes) TaxID=1924098 RepID=UPI003F98F7E2